ncbi:DNA repair protein rad5 [Decorospora gaudefroyi]|uniref:DNA repair protein rad5 n=1 Tax=Decorospora gaudefroyi TaxID=184978 RepID=A0A6A5K205_9PLEO|nr:DNA repair protein rad5 [Decorospora gaudefroyi]
MATDPRMSIQANINMINAMIPTMSPVDIPYYEQLLSGLYLRLEDEQRAQAQNSTMAGPALEPSNDFDGFGYGGHTSPFGTQMPSPPLAKPVCSLKRNLGPADYPEAKRVSGRPSPATPESPASGPWTQPLPSRPSNSEHFVVDLTESDPPTPEPAREPHAQLLHDPFPELHYMYRGDDEALAPADAFTQDFMTHDELAQFLMASTAPGGGYGFQQEPQPNPNNHVLPFEFDAHDDAEHYGEFPLDLSEAKAIEKLFENIQEQAETPEEREPTPAMMTCTLKEYQRIGLTWLLKMERSDTKGSILADEMGLGKTIQALALICANPSPNILCKTTLIIAPVALMHQWRKEIERHVHPRHNLKIHLYHGSGRNVDFARLRQYDIVLTTFGSLTSEYKQMESSRESMLHEQEMRNPGQVRKPKDRLALLGHECMWYRIVIDESHNIRNRNAKASKACADLMARHRLCMTGTPIMNGIDDLYPLLRFLKMDYYLEWSKFNMEIGKAIWANDLQPMKSVNRGTQKRAIKRVQILLKSIMLRRQKDSEVDGKPISTLPTKHTIIDNVEFEDEEYALYKALQTKSQLQMNVYLERNTVTPANYANVLVLLLRLRQACCHPHLIKDLSQPATEGIAEDDLLVRAEELNDAVIGRLKEVESFECPICLEADPNPTIIIPCGHTVCGECVQKLIDPAMRSQQDGHDETSTPKCPHCRGELKARLITDYKHFCKVHCRERLGSADEDEAELLDDESDSDSEEEDDYDDVDEKGNIADFVVDDDHVSDAAEGNDTDLGSASGAKPKSTKRKSKQRGKGKGKGKGKAPAKPRQTLAQLKKESLKSQAAKKRYIRRLNKTYVPSAKINRTVELLKEFRDIDPSEKTLIFSQFTSLLDLIEVPLCREKIRYQRYDGSMKMDARADAINAFMDDPDENVMLVSMKAGNAGLNLWKASRVIIMDPFWNPFIEEQAVDRAHRMPQPREVHVHRLLVPETVEDRIKEMQDRKRAIVDQALDERAAKSLTRLSVTELKYLFGMK